MRTESGGPQKSLCLTPDELTFARRLYLAFGPERFTPRGYYLRIRGGCARCTSEQDVLEIYRAIAAHRRVLRPAPGVRGDDGWCLSPEALDALRQGADFIERPDRAVAREKGRKALARADI